MIKHIVMWNFKQFAAGNSKETNMQMAKEVLTDLLNKVPSLDFIEVGLNFNQSEVANDVVLYSEFSDEKALEEYQVHKEHQMVAAFIRSVTVDRAVVDYKV